MQAELARCGIRLQYGFDPSLPDVHGDEAQLSQVFLNVLRNALDAMSSRRRGAGRPRHRSRSARAWRPTSTSCAARPARASSCASRSPTRGAGIDADTAAQMFEPFFTTKARGTGLGLAISHKIVAEHDGIIRAAPNHPYGTVITVSLPVVAALSHGRMCTARILVADDEESVRWVLVKALEGAGHTVVQASGGREALAPPHRAAARPRLRRPAHARPRRAERRWRRRARPA